MDRATGNNLMEADSKLISPPDNHETNGISTSESPVHRKEYEMNHKYRGKALVFSHDFKNSSKLFRKGNQEDEDRIKEELKKLDFKVEIHKDLKVAEIEKILKKTAKDDEFNYNSDCLMVVVMSHGGKDWVKKNSYNIFAADGKYDYDILYKYFDGAKCPSLHGKPKLFLIQACRGKDTQETSTVRCQSDGLADSNYNLPNNAEFFTFFAAYDDKVCWRNPEKGSYFIQAICDELLNNQKRNYSSHFEECMILAQQSVATQIPQQPWRKSTLNRLLYLRPKSWKYETAV